MAKPDYPELCRLEPRLLELEEDVRAVRDDGRSDWFCSNFTWMPLSARLKQLVGVARIPQPEDDPAGVLYDGAAYITAFEHLSPLMPPCRSCGCSQFEPVRQAQLADGDVG